MRAPASRGPDLPRYPGSGATDTIEEAVEIAKTWPGVDRGLMTIEVRPVIEM
ncbi:MAG: hypothetical protein ACRDP5_04360 [Streptosporangiaceae bacterium]